MFVLITSSQTFRNTTPWAEILTFTLNVIVKKQSHAQTQLRCPGNGSSRQVTARNYCATPSYTVPGDGGEVRAGGDAVLPAGGDRGPRSPRGAVSRVRRASGDAGAAGGGEGDRAGRLPRCCVRVLRKLLGEED